MAEKDFRTLSKELSCLKKQLCLLTNTTGQGSLTQIITNIINNIFGLPMNTTNVLVVSKGGNDVAALAAGKYDWTNHWLNPTVAMANAVSGDTVFVLPGIYTIGTGGNITDNGLQQLVRDGVTLYMVGGAEIQYTNLTGTASIPFFDSGIASTFIVRGNGKLKFNRDITISDTWQCTTNANTVVDFEVDEIDTRRRWGTTSHNALRWRMVGRRYLNRESMLFAFRFPLGNTNRSIHWNFEETTILSENANNQWTRAEIRGIGTGSNAYVNFGRVTYPHGFNLGALFQKTNCASGSTIDFYASSVKRVNDNSVRDYLIIGSADLSNGIVDIKNIDTCSALSLYSGAGTLATTKKTENYQGRIRPGYTGASVILNSYVAQNTQIKTTLDIIVDSLSANLFGVTMLNSVNTSTSGKIVWHNLTNSPIRISNGTTNYGKLENLILSELDPIIASVFNEDAVVKSIKIMNVFATTAVSVANGGVNELIENIVVDSNV